MPGTGLFQCVFTQNNLMTMSVVCCRDIMPDPEFYRQCIEQSYRETVDACLQSASSVGGKAKTKVKTKAKAKSKPTTKTQPLAMTKVKARTRSKVHPRL